MKNSQIAILRPFCLIAGLLLGLSLGSSMTRINMDTLELWRDRNAFETRMLMAVVMLALSLSLYKAAKLPRLSRHKLFVTGTLMVALMVTTKQIILALPIGLQEWAKVFCLAILFGLAWTMLKISFKKGDSQ